jgi:hypothetical protein
VADNILYHRYNTTEISTQLQEIDYVLSASLLMVGCSGVVE